MAERRKRVSKAKPALVSTKAPEPTSQTRTRVNVGVYPLFPDVDIPRYATEYSACFDLKAYFGEGVATVDTYNSILLHHLRTVTKMAVIDNHRGVYIEPGESILVPTGLIFDIPVGWKILIYPRSGSALKKHLKLANNVGVVDEDFTKPTMICLFNNSTKRQVIAHGDRLAQAEIVPYHQANFQILKTEPEQKTSRAGGFGHTGTR